MTIRKSLLVCFGTLVAIGVQAAPSQLPSDQPAPSAELSPASLEAVAWDAARLARGWARLDPTGGCAFYDEKSRALVCWMKDAGALERIDLSQLDFKPQFWVVDDARIWVAAGQRLVLLDPKGNVQRRLNLPGEVADMDRLPDGLVLSYRTLEPFVEKRDMRTGSVAWDFGQKPGKENDASKTLHRIICNEDRFVMLFRADQLNFTLLDGRKGKAMGQIVLTYKDRLPPTLQGPNKAPGALVWAWGHNTAYYAVPASALPASVLEAQGLPALDPKALVLVEMEVPNSRIRFVPTGCLDDFQLIGVHEGQALFTSPQGGLVTTSLK